MNKKTLKLKTKQFQQLQVEINIFSTNMAVDMFTRHSLKRIQSLIKPIVTDYEETYKELVLKYADEGKDSISIKLPKEEGADESEVPLDNPKFKLFLEEIELVATAEESIDFSPLSSEILKKYSIDVFQEDFKKAFEVQNIADFELLYEIFE